MWSPNVASLALSINASPKRWRMPEAHTRPRYLFHEGYNRARSARALAAARRSADDRYEAHTAIYPARVRRVCVHGRPRVARCSMDSACQNDEWAPIDQRVHELRDSSPGHRARASMSARKLRLQLYADTYESHTPCGLAYLYLNQSSFGKNMTRRRP